ncbi:zf-UBR-domain-containing protein [Violaceomyces palustris]|uniref:Zf-UBR-domain-containing protein n=1 Tax=Violaceomyces palustris TaxID=1673888 RepID=A0ACD0NZA6_9BASI|nr:zf-UBR-domain-containing protein [Violaceomyces palustris]
MSNPNQEQDGQHHHHHHPPPSFPSSSSSSSSSLPDPNLPPPSLQPEEKGFTAADLIDRQTKLEARASQAIPFKFDTCTYSMGYIRQPVYACKTCGGGGVCAGCSVSCHSDHQLVELFNKRNFRCDCGTPNLYKGKSSSLACPSSSSAQPNGSVTITEQLEFPENAPPCSLRKPGYDPQNEGNRYGQNFQGSFCYCERGKSYDPEKEEETMFQCLVCEEWLHESCTSLRPKQDRGVPAEVGEGVRDGDGDDEGPPPLVDHECFDLMICDVCVRRDGNQLLRRYAGCRGWIVLLPEEEEDEKSKGKRPQASRDELESFTVMLGETLPTLTRTDPECKEGGRERSRIWRVFGLQIQDENALSTIPEVSEPQSRNSVRLEVEDSERPDGEEGEDGGRTKSGSDLKRGTLNPNENEEEEAEGGRANKRMKTKQESEVQGESDTNESADPTTEGICRLPRTLAEIDSAPTSRPSPWSPSEDQSTDESSKSKQRLDIFLSEDFRKRICKCQACVKLWKDSNLDHVLEAEETYTPPEDPEASSHQDEDQDEDAASVTSSSSTYDLGMAALSKLPREKMLNSLEAYNKFRDALWDHLRPFAQSGKVVDEEAVREFFKNRMERKEARDGR